MNNYVTGSTIKSLREKKNYTQKQLADITLRKRQSNFKMGNRGFT